MMLEKRVDGVEAKINEVQSCLLELTAESKEMKTMILEINRFIKEVRDSVSDFLKKGRG